MVSEDWYPLTEQAFDEKLAEMGLKRYESEASDREEIDFSIVDIHDPNDNVCWVWGNVTDCEVECNHPNVTFGDDDEQGVCELCGATCDWRWENEWEDDGHDEDGRCIGHAVEMRVAHEWHPTRGGKEGLIGKYLDSLTISTPESVGDIVVKNNIKKEK